MLCRILLLLTLTSCVCGTFAVNVTRSSYRAQENDNITLDWTFTGASSPDSLFVLCRLITDHKVSVLFLVRRGVEVPEAQGGRFAGRVQCDKDVLREGRVRLRLSGLRAEDSGVYLCEVGTNDGRSSGRVQLRVSGADDDDDDDGEATPQPQPEARGRIGLIAGGTAAAAAVVCAGPVFAFCVMKVRREETSL